MFFLQGFACLQCMFSCKFYQRLTIHGINENHRNISCALGLISLYLSHAFKGFKSSRDTNFLLTNTTVLLYSIRHPLKYYYQTLESYRGVTPAISLDKMFQQDYILFTLFPELRLS